MSKTLRAIAFSIFASGILLTSCATRPPLPDAPQKIADLQIVDCLLPGQMRRLGTSSYLTPRRPTRTTAADCRLRGGEYVEYDRADYKTALNVWMSAAEKGDAEAQANVGEIFERGLGGTPNYEAAVIWYQKAADQENSRALFNLGTLYERGLGVEKNKLKALNLYRRAWGMPEENIIFQNAAYKEQQAERTRLNSELKQQSLQINLLNKQISSLKTQSAANKETVALQTEIGQLQNWIAKLENNQQRTQQQVTALPVFREPKPIQKARSEKTTGKNIKFGKYYALIIGNQNYSRLEKLYSPVGDAQHVADLLETKYGFSVQTLLDASNIEVMQAFNDLNDVLEKDDNLLVFYAGHGTRLTSGDHENGYWLPINADPPPTDTFWVSNEFITRHLSRIQAKRVLIVADSCYAGLLSSSPGFLFLDNGQTYTDEYIEYKLSKKARLLLASGGDQPVLDNAGDGHSVFAKAFLDELEKSNNILAAPELFVRIRDRVRASAKKVGVDQEPEFKAIKGAGHEVGDFFFVPVNNS